MLIKILPFLAILPATVYSLLSLWCARYFFHNSPQPATASAQPVQLPVTILKPVKGMDEGSFENFASFCQQIYSAPVQLVFAVASADDPVVPVIRKLIDEFPGQEISLNINADLHGPNHKISNLINAFPAARHDLIIICDSDIRVTPGFLGSITRHFMNPDVGLVSSPYRTSNIHGPATAIEALGFSTEMIPNVLTANRLEGISFALGAAMAFRRKSLEDIGGLSALVNYLADDYQLGNKIFRAGWQLRLDDLFVESMLKEESLSSILSRQLRWARTMRVSRPGGYLASGITLPGLAVLLALLTGKSADALAAIVLFYIVRGLSATLFSRFYAQDRLLPAWLWLLPFRDLLAFSTWLLSFFGNNINWRGNRFKIGPEGHLTPIASS
jgi:ceramide glucosyltransferase